MTSMPDITLIKMTETDFADHDSLVRDVRVMKWVTGRAMNTNESRQKFDKIMQANKVHPRLGYFRIAHSLTGEFIGVAKLEILRPDASEAELGYLLLPEFWGKGIASIVAGRLLVLAKELDQIKTVFGIIDPDNIASRKVLLRHHFVHERFETIDGLPGEHLCLRLFS